MTQQTSTTELSIIIVSWNTRDILRNCLASVEKHRHGVALEVIVVDNDSSDGSADMVADEFPDVTLIRNTDNRGFGPANNQGMAIATAPFVLLLNSDTIVLDRVLPDMLQRMRLQPKCAVLSCRVVNEDRSLQRTCFRDPDLSALALNMTGLHRLHWPRWCGRQEMRHWDRSDARDVDVVTGCFMLVRMDAVADVGAFDEQFFFYAEEADWCRRFRDAGWHVRFDPAGNIVHLGGASALKLNEQRSLLLGQALVRLIRKHRGLLHACIAWCFIAGFIASRAAAWTIAAPFIRETEARKNARQRARNAQAATRQLRSVWPDDVTPRIRRIAASQRPRKASAMRQKAA